MVAIFLLLMLLGAPIALAIMIPGVLGIYFSPGGEGLLLVVPQQLFLGVNSFQLLTIPLFVLAGTLMAEGGIARRLMDLAECTVARGRGGLGAATVVSTMFFHGISGSSTADTAAIARVTLPTLKDQGYPVPFATAVLAAAGATATLIPPTIDLIIIGVVANMSIAGLFAGGLIPAVINGIGLISTVVYLSWRRSYGRLQMTASLRQMFIAFVKAVPALFMIVIILGGILGGVFTPTEASVVAVVYGFLISFFVYRDLKLHMLPAIFRSTILLSGGVLFVIASSSVLTYAMTINQVPQSLAAALNEYASSPWLFLLLVQILFFFIGMIMDGLPALIITMPILTPIAVAHGIQPIHFGILVEANLALAMAHPPAGTCLYAACAVSKIPFEKVIVPLIPFLAVLIVTLLIITYVEKFSMFLPQLLHLT
ncbi:MAG TPA: TRAP transporter large permease [Stellaceae bacterium]|nr:TRAP transporter large permease [Stellaceae bacterium]